MKLSEQERLHAWLEPARSLELPARSADEERVRRAEQVSQLARLIQRQPAAAAEQSRRRRFMGVGAAAASLLLFAGAGYVLQRGPASEQALMHDRASLRQVIGKVVATQADGSSTVVSQQTIVAAGDEVSTTGEAFASLELTDQARVDLSSATTVQLTQVTERARAFYLHTGRVDVNVPHLPERKCELKVTTPNAEVTVRGTIFHVEVEQVDGTPVTRVSVSRGSVAVTHQGRRKLVRAGENWSSQKQQAVSRMLEAESREAEEKSRPRKLASSLAEQNLLFQRGLRARDRGEDRKAIRWFEQLMRKYPNSPLLGSARTERNAAKERSQQ